MLVNEQVEPANERANGSKEQTSVRTEDTINEQRNE